MLAYYHAAMMVRVKEKRKKKKTHLMQQALVADGSCGFFLISRRVGNESLSMFVVLRDEEQAKILIDSISSRLT